MTVPMDKLDDLVAGHLEDRLLDPTRHEEVPATVLDRRQERTERRHAHVAELNKRATETDLRLKRLYDAFEGGVADLDDPDLKHRIASLKAIRDQSRLDADRASAMLVSAGQKAITAPMLAKFAQTARERMRLPGGGYRCDRLRALVQRVEVNDGEGRIPASKSDLLCTLAAAGVAGTLPGAMLCSDVAGRRGLPSNLLWAGRLLLGFLFEEFKGFCIIPQETMHPDRRQHV